MSLHEGEPEAGPWQVESFDAVAERLLPDGKRPVDRPWVIAVDGRGAGGKSTLAARFGRWQPRSAVVHTDDVAWNHAIMDWADLLVQGVLEPVHRGEPVQFRPPAWDLHGRTGAIEVPAGLDLVVVEGVGASRRDLAEWYDATVWVQSDQQVAYERGIVRDGGSQEVIDFWWVWEAEEVPFFVADRPWERAALIVSGTPTVDHDVSTQIVVGARRA